MDAARYPAAPRDRPPPPNPGGPLAPPPPRSSPAILERFRAMLRARDDELRGPDGEDPPPPEAEDVVPLYEDLLSELTFNSKPVITELTIIAGEQREYAEGIADVICSRILEVPVDQKLSCLYLLDSIVKNIGGEYVRYFSVRLPEVFCEAYNQVPSNFHPAMRHLFRTWTTVFSSSVRRKIQNELQFSSPESQQSSGSGNFRNSDSPSPRPAHGIHVNPKYLEARRQFDRPVNDARKTNEHFSGLDMHETKTSSEFGDYDLDQNAVVDNSGTTRGVSLRVGMGPLGHHSSVVDPRNNHIKPSSPKASLGRLGERISWQEKSSLNEDIASDLSAIRSRELIDAYGNSKGKNVLPLKPPKMQRVDDNNTTSEAAGRNWQTSEEEEYVWEDMSPTLADRNRNSRLLSHDADFGNFGTGTRLRNPDASILDVDFRRSNWSLRTQSSHDMPHTIVDEDRTSNRFTPLSIYREPQVNVVPRQTPHYRHESWNSFMPQQSSKSSLSPRSQGRIFQPPFSPADVPALSQRIPLSYTPDADSPFERLSNTYSEPIKTDTLLPVPSNKLLAQAPTSINIVPSTIWPSASKPQLPAPTFVHSQQKQFADRTNSIDMSRPTLTHGPDIPFSSPWQPSDSFDSRVLSSGMPVPTLIQNSSSLLIDTSKQNSFPQFPQQDPQGSVASLRDQIQQVVQYPTTQLPTQGNATFPCSMFPNPFPVPTPSFPVSGIPENSIHMNSGPLPPLPPGPPPAMPQIHNSGNNTNSMTSNPMPSAFSGLISSLVSQGLISLTPQTLSQDSVVIDFNPDHLKIRHESTINDLYVNLPRQCTTCGLRFKCQEEHSNHMDWHVTKNRMSKSRKQKSSRKWFVSSKEWLSGAETLGIDAVPGFLPMDTAVDKNEEKELAVPADENQNICALCGEPFEDFYSDEADEWMYKGAVYLNAPDGSTEGMDKFRLGPIVHAKCRSETTEV